MKDSSTKAHTDTMILAVLRNESLHGYAIAREIERRGENLLTCKEVILYPALRALERDGLVSSKWEIQPNGPARKIYTITKKGQSTLAKRTRAWHQLHSAMSNIIGGNPHEQTA